MVECYLCKGKLRVTRDKHVYDEKLKKRYHFKCFAGICRVCDMPVYTKSEHKTIGSNVWHGQCYKKAHRHNPATEEGVNRKLQALARELREMKVSTKRDREHPPATEEGVNKKLQALARELDKMRLGRKNPIKTIDDASYKAMQAARKAADIPRKLWREFEETYFRKHPPKFERENPRRPTKEFWAKHYPGILKEARKKFKSKKRAEEYARGATAQIWHHTMGPKKKAKYERIRRKREARENPETCPDCHIKMKKSKDSGGRMWFECPKCGRAWLDQQHASTRAYYEARENPIRHLMFSGDRAPAAVFPELEGKKTQLRDGWWIIPDSLHNRQTLQQYEVPYTKHTRPSAAEILRRAEEEEGRENPPMDMERFEKELLETLDTTFLIYETKKLPATKSVTLMSMRPTPVDKGIYSVVDTPEHRRLLEDLDIKYTELKISAEHAKLLIKEMLKRDRQNPTLVTPELETDIVGAFKRVIHGMGTEADKALVRMAREADVVMSTGPSVLLKRNPGECDLVENPDKLDYIIQDEFGTTFETGKGTEEQAEARALHYNQKHMRQFKVIYPKTESPEVKKAAQTAAKEMLKS